MRDVLEGLRRDHGNFKMLLSAFERELKVFDTGGRPDYELIDDILRYSLDFPDQEHHKTEEFLARRLLREHAGIRAILENIAREHQDLRYAGMEVLTRLEAILNEEPVDREGFVRLCRSFIDDHRNHMTREEKILFPLVEEMLPVCENIGLKLDGSRGMERRNQPVQATARFCSAVSVSE